MRTARWWPPTSAAKPAPTARCSQADHNWRLAPIASATPLDIRFETAPGAKATQFIEKYADYPMKAVGSDETGFAIWQVDLQKQAEKK